jgi:hypothetical protein
VAGTESDEELKERLLRSGQPWTLKRIGALLAMEFPGANFEVNFAPDKATLEIVADGADPDDVADRAFKILPMNILFHVKGSVVNTH